MWEAEQRHVWVAVGCCRADEDGVPQSREDELWMRRRRKGRRDVGFM